MTSIILCQKLSLSILIIVIFYFCILGMEKMWQKPASIPSGLALLVEKFATAIAAVGKMVGCILVIYTIRLVTGFDICFLFPSIQFYLLQCGCLHKWVHFRFTFFKGTFFLHFSLSCDLEWKAKIWIFWSWLFPFHLCL